MNLHIHTALYYYRTFNTTALDIFLYIVCTYTWTTNPPSAAVSNASLQRGMRRKRSQSHYKKKC